jgi:hypothetical protein
MNGNHDRIRRARGPLTGIALLCIGASVAVYFTATSDNGVSSLVATSVSVNTDLAEDPSTSTSGTTPTTGPSSSTGSTIPGDSTTTSTTLVAPTQPPTTSKPSSTTTRPATTTSTTAAPTTTKAPQPVSWRNVIPSIPGGGSAKLIDQSSTRYAVSIAYPSYASAALIADFANAFKSAGWTATTAGNTVTVSKGSIQGTVKVTASGDDSTAVMDLRSVA